MWIYKNEKAENNFSSSIDFIKSFSLSLPQAAASGLIR